MRSKKEVEEKLEAENKEAERHLTYAMKAKSEDEKNMHIRLRNNVLERIYTLEWVLKKF